MIAFIFPKVIALFIDAFEMLELISNKHLGSILPCITNCIIRHIRSSFDSIQIFCKNCNFSLNWSDYIKKDLNATKEHISSIELVLAIELYLLHLTKVECHVIWSQIWLLFCLDIFSNLNVQGDQSFLLLQFTCKMWKNVVTKYARMYHNKSKQQKMFFHLPRTQFLQQKDITYLPEYIQSNQMCT